MVPTMEPPNPTAIDMRHTKLKASEAALIAGELVKPTWASKNEGIHERVSFEDTLWGFEMAGGAYYKTPLRIAYVKPDSRAERACIRMGDMVLRINGKDTANMTLQEAHQLVVDAGLNLKIAVTSPEDKVNAHYDYEDPIIEEPEVTPEELKAMELERVQRALERASRCRDLPWPWVRRKWVIYRESNCFMVPSKYEDKHKDKFPELPSQKIDYFYPVEKKKHKNTKENNKIANGNNDDEILEEDEEYEEVEEEMEEDEEIGTENEIDDAHMKENSSERLEDTTIENNDIIVDKSVNLSTEEDSTDKLDSEVEMLEENDTEELQRKGSNQSASSYELDNNNNHVAKHKDENINEENLDYDTSDDRMINEIVENSNRLQENLTKSDDDIIDSVLNDNKESNLQNER